MARPRPRPAPVIRTACSESSAIGNTLLLLEFDENWNLGREVGMMPLQSGE
jgi:hypothetical protein